LCFSRGNVPRFVGVGYEPTRLSIFAGLRTVLLTNFIVLVLEEITDESFLACEVTVG
jgi:hypothetical protein